MAIVRGAYGGGQIKGSISGTTFQQGPYGTVIRNRTVPVNPQSPKQVIVRTSMATLSFRWSNILTTAQRSAWDAYAALTPLPDRFGQLVPTKGRQMFLRYNVAAFALSLPIVDAAPATPGEAAAPIYSATLSVGGARQIDTATPVLALNDFIIWRLSLPTGLARNFYKAPFSFITIATFGTVFPLALTMPFPLSVGQKYFFAARLFQADGKVGPETLLPTLVTP